MTSVVIEAPSPQFAPRGPVEVQQFLDVKAQELAQLEADLQEAHTLAEAAEFAWVEHFDMVMEELEESGEKLPGEEKCIGIARRRGGWEAWSQWRREERYIGRLRERAGLIKSAISACQSEAKLLRAGE